MMKGKLGKFLSNFGFFCGCLMLLSALIGDWTSASERVTYGCVAVFLCLISKVHTFRRILISVLFTLVSVSVIFTAAIGDTSIDAAWMLTLLFCIAVALYYGLKATKKHKTKNISGIRMAEVDSMSGLEFEEFTANLLRKLGYTDVSVTKASGDQGIDVLATKNGQRYAIQCKNYSNKLDNTPVQEAYAGMRFYQCDKAVVVTNSTFTEGAKALAATIGVQLWDREVLARLIEQTGQKKKLKALNKSEEGDNRSLSRSGDTDCCKQFEQDTLDCIDCPQNYVGSKVAVNLNEEFARYGGVKAELLTIDLMGDTEFRDWCATILEKSGFTGIEAPVYGRKNGVDLIAEYNGHRYAVLCKHSRADLGDSAIQKNFTGKHVYNCDVGFIITNQYFKDSAKELAEKTYTLIWDRDIIMKNLDNPYVENNNLEKRDRSESVCIPQNADPLISDAVDTVFDAGYASVSLLHKRLCIGYARSARIIDEMEKLGIVGPFDDSNPRTILITKEQWEYMKSHDFKTLPF